MKTIAFVALLAAAFTSAGFAQDPAETSPEKAAVIANDRLYEAAYANADVEALVHFFRRMRTTPRKMVAPLAGARRLKARFAPA